MACTFGGRFRSFEVFLPLYFKLNATWYVIIPYIFRHLLSLQYQAAYSKEKHISKVALTSIHDILSELLKRRNELPHFWFYDALFKPFDTLMSADGCEEDMHDQVGITNFFF